MNKKIFSSVFIVILLLFTQFNSLVVFADETSTDSNAPSPPVNVRLDSATDTGLSNSDYITSNTRPTIIGNAEAYSTVTVYVDGTANGTTTADVSGNWIYQVSLPLSEGGHSMYATATDTAGNKSMQSSSVLLIIDTTKPTVSMVATPAFGVYFPGQNLDFSINFTESVFVSSYVSFDSPYIDVNLDSGKVKAYYQNGSGTPMLLFRYTVNPSDFDPNGITIGETLFLNGSSIQDIAGNSANLTLQNVGPTPGVLINGLFTINFNKNQGDTEASPATKTALYGGIIDALPTAPTREGFTFSGWNTKADGTGSEFTATTPVTSYLTVYAQWTESSYTVTFDKNQGDTEANPITKTALHGETIDALPTAPTREGYTFTGWNTNADGSGSGFTAATPVTSNQTVYAQWTKSSYTVTFDKNQGDTEASPATKTALHGETIVALPTAPTRQGYTFAGWNTKADGTGTKFTATTPVTSNLTLYAQWTKINTSGGVGGGVIIPNNSWTIDSLLNEKINYQGIEINLPIGSFSNSLRVEIEKVQQLSEVWNPIDKKIVSNIFDITKDTKGSFLKPITITLPFSLVNIDKNKFNVAIYWLDEVTNSWFKLDNTKIDWDKGTVSGDVNHFTKFAVLASEKKLSDISGHWAEESINKLVQLGAVSGYSDNTFKPNEQITRAEFVKMIVRALGLELSGSKVFTDTKNHWAKSEIATAYEHGMITGYNQSEFGADDPITREQMTTIIANTFELQQGQSKTFSDQSKISSWALEAIQKAASSNIIKGYEDGSFQPKKYAIRAEAVTVIIKALKK
ncbi:MAG TPA: InlB B-repeat-containing protein [Ureibacillus sp.]|nr:InlB B-repeat-containing protein [Ureibacillus sp.]